MRQMLIAGLVSLMCASAAAQGEDRATVQLRDGTRIEGRIDSYGNGELSVRVSMADQRRIPAGNVALIDRVGAARGLPDTELREATGSQHLLLLSDGSSVKGQLINIRGGAGSAEENEPRTYVFRTADGQERRYSAQQVARIYLGNYPFAAAATSGTSDLASGPVPPGAIRVPATSGWVSTGMRVRRGDVVTFNTTGEVQLSDNRSDRATSPGTTRRAPNAPLPSVNAGALIGRIGNGEPFGIGNQTSVPMPNDGMLYLAVNDDERSDNAGEFIVQIGRARRR